MENQFQSTLFLLTQELLQWQEDFTNPPGLLSQCLNKLIKYLIHEKKYYYPRNYKELIHFLKTVPVDKWSCNQDDIDEQFIGKTLIDEEGRVNRIYADWLEEMGALEEGQQKDMKKFLLKCRELAHIEDKEKYEKFYREGRSFVSPSNAIIDAINLQKNLNLFPKELSKIINQWTEYYDIKNKEVIVCPVCGKPLDFSKSSIGKCSDICEYYRKNMKKNYREIVIDTSLMYYTFTKGIYKYTLLPSIAEQKIYSALKAKFQEYTVELYPEIDKYDIRISNENIVVDIDVKDHKSPQGLVSILLNNQDASKLHSKEDNHYIYLVIPEHRKDIYTIKGDYKKDLKNLLKSNNLKIEVLYEKELYKVVDEIFNDDF